MSHVDFAPLRELLNQQLAQYGKLLTTMEDMGDSLVKVDAETLDKLNRVQAAQLRQLATLEKKRQVAESAICAELSLGNNCTLTDLLAHAQSDDKAALEKLQADFLELIPRLQKAHNINRELLQLNMDLNETMLSLLTGPEDPLNNFYSADGSEPEEKIISPGIFDQQI